MWERTERVSQAENEESKRKDGGEYNPKPPTDNVRKIQRDSGCNKRE